MLFVVVQHRAFFEGKNIIVVYVGWMFALWFAITAFVRHGFDKKMEGYVPVLSVFFGLAFLDK